MPKAKFRSAPAAITTVTYATILLCANMFMPSQAQTKAGAATGDRNLVVQAAAPASAQSNQRVALVIGNAAYKEAPLTNPVNDARAIGQALQESGFTVILRENTDQRGMLSALREFGDKLRGGGTGLFYYAGHGMQIKGRNYLIPVGANVDREDEVAYSAVDAQAVLDKMESAGNAANIMILDACRNNPFVRASRSGQGGLAQMEAPVGTLVAFATSPGAVASDGVGANGLYTQHLLSAMRQNGSKVEDVFKQVRANVRRDSQGKQVPWESTSLEGDFYFRGGASLATVAAVDSSVAVENALWDAVKNSNLPIELQAYLNRYPSGRYVALARSRLGQLQSGVTPVTANNDPALADRPITEAPSSVSAPAKTRPVAQSNSFGYTVGDRWRYQVVDKFKGEVVSNYALQVDRIEPNGDLTINRGIAIWTAQGSPKYSRNNERQRYYSGNFVQYPTTLKAGEKTKFEYQIESKFVDGRNFRESSSATLLVKGQEKVKTPAGEFDAWRVELEVFWQIDKSNSRGSYSQVSWYVPQLHRYVAWEEESRNFNGSFNRRDRHELTSFSVRGAENLALR
jgi:hypothetical protein